MNKEYQEEFGKRVKALREKLGLSQEEVATRMGYKSKVSIHKIEKGISEMPISKLVKLSEILKVNVLELMGYTNFSL